MITLEQLLLRRRVLAVSRKRHRPRTLPVATPPRAAILQHTALLHGISRELDAAVADELAAMGLGPVRTDAADGDAGTPRGLGSMAARLDRLVAKILQRKQFVVALDGVAANVAGHTREQFQRQVTAALGVDLPNSDPDFHRVFRDFRAKNTALIKTMAEDKVSRVRRALREAGAGTRVEDVAERLRAETGITERHAALVARDQVLKLNGQVTEQRHREAGVTEYVWRTSRDERVREEHRALDGTRHKYAEPPVQNRKGERANPGQFFQCRCTMEPVIEGFDEDFAPGQHYAHGTASPVVWSPNAKLTSGRAPAKPAPDLATQLAEHQANPPQFSPSPDEGTDGPVTVRHPGPSTDRPIPAPMTVAHPERAHELVEAPPSADLSVRTEAAPSEGPGKGRDGTPPTFARLDPGAMRAALSTPAAASPSPGAAPPQPSPSDQLVIRAQGREMLDDLNLPKTPTHPAFKTPVDEFHIYEVRTDAAMGQENGMLTREGRMVMSESHHRNLTEYMARIENGTTAAASHEQENAVLTYLHETLHEHSALVGDAYDGIGHDIEESMTERLARRHLREKYQANSPWVQTPGGGAGVITHPYDVEMVRIRNAVHGALARRAKQLGPAWPAPTLAEVDEMLDAAAQGYKQATAAGGVLRSQIEVVDAMVRALTPKLPPGLNDGPSVGVVRRAIAAMVTPPKPRGTP